MHVGDFTTKREEIEMKKLLGTTCLAFAAAAACVAIGPAGFASADGDLNGTYNYTVDETQATTNQFAMKDPKVEVKQWVIASCGPGCAKVTIPDNPKGGGDLKMNNGRWEMTKEFSIMNCNPGSPDVTVVTSLDPVTLQGTEVNTNHCLNNIITAPATLTPA
jgi:hypothetical protein